MSIEKDLINIAPSFYGISMVPKEYWELYGKALLTIAGADGEVSEPEMAWLVEDLAEEVGVSDDIVAAWRSFDFENGDLEEIFFSFNIRKTVNFSKLLIYDAIRMSSADDDYSMDEKEDVSRAAQILRVSKEDVISIEALVGIEKAAEKLRITLF